ncbi:polysaccharide biosynthesis domain containing protein 1 [Chytriomyces hyalinus]|nr:polysaccharide biosynthesis domain containing protein 1 [Chytriomyces hyalinus]
MSAVPVTKSKPFSAETAENHEDVEKIWSVKALHHAETYFKLISSIDAKKMRLTKIDDDIYCEFKETFPEIDVENLQEIEQFKSDQAKDKWRNWIPKFEAKVQDFNYGTLLRNRAAEDYGPDNAFFVTRIQFLAIEIARNKEGYNSIHSVKK